MIFTFAAHCAYESEVLMTSLRNSLESFYNNVGKRILYWLPILLLSLLSYWFSVSQQTIGIDDLRRDYYLGSQATKLSGRWGMILWTRLMGATRYAAFIDKYFALVFLMGAGIVFAAVFYTLDCQNGKESRSIWPYTLLTCSFITYPLINEIWEYTGTDFFVMGNMLLCGLVLLTLNSCRKRSPLMLLLCSLPLTLVASSYEAGVFFYITASLIVLFYRFCVLEEPNLPKWTWIREGLFFAVPVTLGVILRFVIGKIILIVNHLEYYGGGDAALHWGDTSVIGLIKLLLTNYVAKGLIYFPIGVFVVLSGLFAVYVIIRCVCRRRLLPLILGLCVAFSLFLLTWLQGSVMPYRTAQTLTIFCSFVIFLLLKETGTLRYLFSQKRAAVLPYAVTLTLSLLLCLHMATYLNWILSLDNQRSENERAIAYEIGYKLKSEYPDKPVVFVGWEYVGSYVESQMRTDINSRNGNLYIRIYRRLWHEDPANLRSAETDVNSVLTWSKGTDDMMREFFRYHGFDLNIAQYSLNLPLYEEAEAKAKELGLSEYEISEQEDYIIVCLNWIP